MKTKAKPKPKAKSVGIKLLTEKERRGLNAARNAASLTRGKDIDVSGYRRRFYQLPSGRWARYARWVDVEDAARRLCRDHDRRGPQPGDKARARAMIVLLQDTLGV